MSPGGRWRRPDPQLLVQARHRGDQQNCICSGAKRVVRVDLFRSRGQSQPDTGLNPRSSQPRAHLCPTTRQFAGLSQEWVAGTGLDPSKFGTHSLRRIKAALVYRLAGNLRALQLLLGHSDIESTVRYLGIEVDDAIELAEKVEIGPLATAAQRSVWRWQRAWCSMTVISAFSWSQRHRGLSQQLGCRLGSQG
jgi:Phage integrase family